MKHNDTKKGLIHPVIFYSLITVYLELIYKYIITNNVFNKDLLYLTVFTIPVVMLFTFLSKLFNETINRIITFLITTILVVYFEVQFIFFKLFSVPFSFATIGLADQALDFTTVIKDAILAYKLQFGLILVPLLLIILLTILNRIDCRKYTKTSKFTLFIMFIISYLSTYLFLIPYQKEDFSASKLYYQIDDQISIISKFGLVTYTKIDIKRLIVGYEPEINLEGPNKYIEELGEESTIYGNNELDLNFNRNSKNKNIQKLNKYFDNATPSNKSEYTGMFKDKNVIFILAEGFNEIAVDKDRTPTLYKLINTGFNFTNFYSPVFLSTTGGEFQATTGLIPTQEILNNWKSKTPTITYGLGNAFGSIGYNVQSYHNWTYTYYNRNKTMKTIGFKKYTGCGNGLEKKINCNWLPSDIAMIDATIDDYTNSNKKFATYYVSVSGHSPYNKGDNIARKYMDYVKDTDYSSSVKYYLAAQVELDKMLEELINKLEEKNILDDTVIALVGDHYPYTLSAKEINEVSSYKKDETIEINRSNFILWNSTMKEPIVIDKVGSQIDVLPTILNIFGVNYDSRLILGKDILSNSEGIAIFSNRSWVTDYGTYNANTRKFTLKPGKTLEDEKAYVSRINSKVSNYFTISKLIIDTNYYTYILEG